MTDEQFDRAINRADQETHIALKQVVLIGLIAKTIHDLSKKLEQVDGTLVRISAEIESARLGDK